MIKRIFDLSLVKRRCSSSANSVFVNKIFTQNELDKFTKLTGDENPIHSTQYNENDRLVHGAFLNGVISGIIGTQLPGPGSIVISQKFVFPNKCRINKNTEITVKLLNNRKISLVHYECKQDGEIVFEGEAKVMLPRNQF